MTKFDTPEAHRKKNFSTSFNIHRNHYYHWVWRCFDGTSSTLAYMQRSKPRIFKIGYTKNASWIMCMLTESRQAMYQAALLNQLIFHCKLYQRSCILHTHLSQKVFSMAVHSGRTDKQFLCNFRISKSFSNQGQYLFFSPG